MAKRKPSRNRKQVKRQTRRFQLRVEHPIDNHVAEILDYKRSKRSEVTAIRDGVRLLWALENDDLSVLFELFPHMKSKMEAGGNGGAGGGTLEDLNAKLELLLSQATTGGYMMKTGNYEPKPIPAAAPPVAFVQAAKPVSADEIADNMLAGLAMFD